MPEVPLTTVSLARRRPIYCLEIVCAAFRAGDLLCARVVGAGIAANNGILRIATGDTLIPVGNVLLCEFGIRNARARFFTTGSAIRLEIIGSLTFRAHCHAICSSSC